MGIWRLFSSAVHGGEGTEMRYVEKTYWNLVEMNMKTEKKSGYAVKIHKIAIVFCGEIWYNKTTERRTNRKYSKRW